VEQMKGAFCASECVCGEYLKWEIVVWTGKEKNQ